jgi:N6-adenosine-specific RNA methylase IME4
MGGTGYWFINWHEIVLIGTRGNIPAPAPGTQLPSIIRERRRAHSEKPEKFYQMVETYFPNLPKIELNARRKREGWTTRGTLEFEAPR